MAHGSVRGSMEGALCGGTQKDTCICTSPPQGDGSWGRRWGLAKVWLSARPTAQIWGNWEQVSFLGIRNRGNRNNGFYSWDYVDLGLNSAHATKNSGLRPLGLNSEIKTTIVLLMKKS